MILSKQDSDHVWSFDHRVRHSDTDVLWLICIFPNSHIHFQKRRRCWCQFFHWLCILRILQYNYFVCSKHRHGPTVITYFFFESLFLGRFWSAYPNTILICSLDWCDAYTRLWETIKSCRKKISKMSNVAPPANRIIKAQFWRRVLPLQLYPVIAVLQPINETAASRYAASAMHYCGYHSDRML